MESRWGPTEEELINFRQSEFTAQVMEEDLYESDEEEEDLEGAEYFDDLEAAGLIDHYRV